MSFPHPPEHDAAHGAILARGALFNALAFLASNLRGIFTFLIARLLGGVALGTFGLAWATMDLASKVGTLGLDTSAIAFVARAEAVGDRVGSRRIMRASLAMALGASVGLAIAGFWFAWTVAPRLGQRPELARATAVILLAMPGIALYRVSNALSRGMAIMHHDIYSRGLTESFGSAAALAGAVLLGAREFAPEVGAIVGTLASGVVAWILARRVFGPWSAVESGATGRGPAAALMNASAPIAVYDLLNIGVMNIDVIMLGAFVGRAPGVTLETLGIYAAAVEVAGGLRKVSQAFNPIFTPIVTRQLAAGRMREAEGSYGYLARWMLAILLPAVAVLALSGGTVMTIFGAAFRRGGPWTAVVGVACALNAFVGLGETILMVERPRINLFNSSIAFAAAVGLNLLLIPAFGPIGAALGMVVPYAIQGVLRGVEITWLFKWRWPWRALVKPWAAALAALPLAVIVRVSGAGAAIDLASAAVYLAGYLVAWRVIGLEPSDRAVLAQLRPRTKRA